MSVNPYTINRLNGKLVSGQEMENVFKVERRNKAAQDLQWESLVRACPTPEALSALVTAGPITQFIEVAADGSVKARLSTDVMDAVNLVLESVGPGKRIKDATENLFRPFVVWFKITYQDGRKSMVGFDVFDPSTFEEDVLNLYAVSQTSTLVVSDRMEMEFELGEEP